MFASMGVPVYFTDDRAKTLYDTSDRLVEDIRKILGDDVVECGRLRKDIMAKKLFADKELLGRVEEVVHPAVIEDFKRWRDSYENRGIPFVIIESAIFLENPALVPLADKVLVITAPLELRISRVQSRSNLSREQIVERINNQWSDSRRVEMADFVIVSDEQKALLPQVLDIYKSFGYGNR